MKHRTNIQPLLRHLCFGALVALSAGMIGCSNSKPLSSQGNKSPAILDFKPDTAPIISDSSCATPLNASIAPTNTQSSSSVTWQVSAAGCTGKYSIEVNGIKSPDFSRSIQYTRQYSPGTYQEKVKVFSKNESGQVLKEIEIVSAEFQIGAVSNFVEPPSCEIKKASPALPGKPVAFALITKGDVRSATINGIPAPLNTPVLIPPMGDLYFANAEVSGPNGKAYCSTTYLPPSCKLKVLDISSSKPQVAQVEISIMNDVTAAQLDGKPLTLTTAGTGTIRVPVPVDPGPKLLKLGVLSKDLDAGECSVNFTVPPPTCIFHDSFDTAESLKNYEIIRDPDITTPVCKFDIIDKKLVIDCENNAGAHLQLKNVKSSVLSTVKMDATIKEIDFRDEIPAIGFAFEPPGQLAQIAKSGYLLGAPLDRNLTNIVTNTDFLARILYAEGRFFPNGWANDSWLSFTGTGTPINRRTAYYYEGSITPEVVQIKVANDEKVVTESTITDKRFRGGAVGLVCAEAKCEVDDFYVEVTQCE